MFKYGNGLPLFLVTVFVIVFLPLVFLLANFQDRVLAEEASSTTKPHLVRVVGVRTLTNLGNEGFGLFRFEFYANASSGKPSCFTHYSIDPALSGKASLQEFRPGYLVVVIDGRPVYTLVGREYWRPFSDGDLRPVPGE